MTRRLYGATISWDDASGNMAWLELDVTTDEQHQMVSQITDHPTEFGSISDNVTDDPHAVTIRGVVSRCPTPASDGLSHDRTAGKYGSKDLQLPDVTSWVEKISELEVPSPAIQPNLAGLASAVVGAIMSGGPPEFHGREAKKAPNSQSVYGWYYDEEPTRPADAFLLLSILRLAHTPVRFVSPLTDIDGLMISSVEVSRTKELGMSAEFSISLRGVTTVVAGQADALPSAAEPSAQPRKITSTATEAPTAEVPTIDESILSAGGGSLWALLSGGA